MSCPNVAFDGAVTWPLLGGSEDGSTLSVALFDHRRCEDVINAANDYVISQSGFYCVFIAMRPIHTRLNKVKQDQLKKQMIADLNCRLTRTPRKDQSLIILALDLVAVACGHTLDDGLLLSTLLHTNNSCLLRYMNEPLDFISTIIKCTFQDLKKTCRCFGHTFQSQSSAICIIGLIGGAVDDVVLVRSTIACMLPNCPIPLAIAHVPQKKEAHLTVGDMRGEAYLMWAAHTNSYVKGLEVNVGNAYPPEWFRWAPER